MSNFKGNYLRVLTPRTIDGVTPRMDGDRLIFKEDHLPMSAKPFLEEQNKNLPEILKKRIEIVSDETVTKTKQK